MSYMNFDLSGLNFSGANRYDSYKALDFEQAISALTKTATTYTSYTNADFEERIANKTFESDPMKIDNYIIISFAGEEPYNLSIPVYPDSINESTNSNWSEQSIVGRSNPVAAFTGTGYRTATINLELHREISNDPDEIEKLLNNIRRAVYPKFLNSGYIPAIVTCQFGEFKMKGICTSVSYDWKKPIIDNRYQRCDLSFEIREIIPEGFGGAISTFSTAENPFY